MLQQTQISDNPILLIPRFVDVLRIEYLDFVKGEAKILFRVSHRSEFNVDVGLTREIWVTVSDENKVTPEGVVVSWSTIPQLEDEETLDYEARFAGILENGLPEFSYWWEGGKQMNLENALRNGILLLDNLKFFD